MKINILAAQTAVLFLLLSGCSGAESSPAPPAPQVTIAYPRVEAVVDWDEYVGRFEAIESVDVKPRVTGYLQRVAFRDGQYVRAGQTLFTVDARPAQAQLDQARAQLVRAQATLANARTELARSQTLARSQAASKEEVEARQAAVRAGAADVSAAQAAVRAQQLNVGFTRVAAPISGRVSERMVDPGNAVTADETVLTRIVSTDPIHFAFEGSEALLLKYLRQNAGATPGTAVRIRLQDEAAYTRAGQLDFVDNIVNSGAGTIRARAVVPNPDGFLRPGMFGHMRLAGSQAYRAMLIPDTAIVTDAARRVIYVVDKANMVGARPVELGPIVGNLRVVRSGIGPRDRVVIGGIQRVRPGQKVQPKPGRVPPLAVPEGGGADMVVPSPPSSTATPAISSSGR